jgi:ankyrin repeat protein
MAPPSSSADRRQAFLSAVKAQVRARLLRPLARRPLTPRAPQKLDSVRWALAHGGQNPGTRDDEGFTAIHIAAAGNRPKVLQLMLDLCRRSRELELMDLRDGSVRVGRAKQCSDDCSGCGHITWGLGPLTLAGVTGQGEDMTALMMAAANGHEACVRELLYAGATCDG